MMADFYSSYSAGHGELSNNAFNLFWRGEYRLCADLYEAFIRFIGSASYLGMRDLIMYYHCLHRLGRASEIILDMPRPPARSEICSIYDYEVSVESSLALIEPQCILTQPVFLHKAVLAARVGIDNGCKSVIETGTYLGITSYLFSGAFDNVNTIEADRALYAASTSWLSACATNVTTHLGDSGVLLEKLLDSCGSRTLLFLDAHYSTGITSNEFGTCPLDREIKAIYSSSFDGVVIIDDIRDMGRNGYPAIEQILAYVPRGRTVSVKYDQMIIS